MPTNKINWIRLLKRPNIGRRFALAIFVFSSVATLALTAFQLSVEYQKDVSKITSQLDEIHDSYAQSLTYSLWTTDKESLQLHLDGIIKLPNMKYIEIYSDKDEILATAGISHQSNHIISRSYPLTYVYRGEKILLGKLYIVGTLDGVYARLKAKALTILLTQAIMTFLVSLFILYLFHILVGRHLAMIANFMMTLKDLKSDTQLKIHRAQTTWTKDDELDQVVNSINVMRKNLELSIHQLMQSKKDLSILTQVVDQVPLATFMTDTQGVIQYANQQALTMSGYFIQELIGKKMSIFTSGIHTNAFYKDLWETIALKKVVWRGTIINKMKNTENLDCLSMIFPILNANNEVTDFVTIQEDVTQQRIKEKLFMMQTRQAQMGEMLSMIAHQWRQPLASISVISATLTLDIMMDDYKKEFFQERLETISSLSQYLSSTIDDFRGFFKEDKELKSTSLLEIVHSALRIIGSALESRGIEIEERIDDTIILETYPNEVVQVLLNLFKNAEDAFEENKTKDPKISIGGYTIDDTAYLNIQDNGGGIPADIIDKVFDPYFSTKTKKDGTGLGLYMSKTIIEEHCGGKINLKNRADGACFELLLPFKVIGRE